MTFAWKPSAIVTDLGALAIGNSTMARRFVVASNVLTATGSARFAYFTATQTALATTARMDSGAVAAAAAPTLVRVGLYTVDDAGAGSLVAATANDVTLFASTYTTYTRALDVPHLLRAGERYAACVLVVTAVTAPQLSGCALGGGGDEGGLAPRISGRIDAQSDLPLTFLESDMQRSTQMPYIAFG